MALVKRGGSTTTARIVLKLSDHEHVRDNAMGHGYIVHPKCTIPGVGRVSGTCSF